MAAVVALVMLMTAAGVIFMLLNPIGRRLPPSPQAENAVPTETTDEVQSPPVDEAMVVEDTVCTGPDGAQMSVTEAESLAVTGECGQTGKLQGRSFCNSGTATWWLALEPTEPKSGCNPACVVHVGTKAVEVNWRCTGLIPPR